MNFNFPLKLKACKTKFSLKIEYSSVAIMNAIIEIDRDKTFHLFPSFARKNYQDFG